MYVVVFFNFTPIIVGIFLLILALAGELAQALPVIEIIFWVLFGALSIASLVLCFAAEAKGWLKKASIVLITVVAYTLAGFKSHEFFRWLVEAYGTGNFSGIIEFIFTLIFGGMEWLFAFYGLAYASFGIMSAEEDKYWRHLIISILLLVAVWFIFF